MIWMATRHRHTNIKILVSQGNPRACSEELFGGLACDHVVDLTRWGLHDELGREVVALVRG